MLIQLTGLTLSHHRFQIQRDDGSSEAVELETRSLLIHDLTHYAVERALGLTRAFYGSLASGASLPELSDRTKPWPVGTELAYAESIVGPMQSHLTGKKLVLPDWPFIEKVEREYRAAFGRWRATRFGDSCVLEWP
jgi:hypothetical protein